MQINAKLAKDLRKAVPQEGATRYDQASPRWVRVTTKGLTLELLRGLNVTPIQDPATHEVVGFSYLVPGQVRVAAGTPRAAYRALKRIARRCVNRHALAEVLGGLA